MQRILISWIGKADLRASDIEADPGPTPRFLRSEDGRAVQHVFLFNDFLPPEPRGDGGQSLEEYVRWLAERSGLPAEKLQLLNARHSLANDLQQMWSFIHEEVERIRNQYNNARFVFPP